MPRKPPAGPRHPNWGKLPDKDTLERMYVQQGLSYKQIGEKYGVPKKTVYNTMVRRAKRAGTPWPLKMSRPDWKVKAAKKHSREFWDGVNPMMVRAEIVHASETYKISIAELGELAGVCRSTMYAVAGGRKASMSRESAHKVIAAIEKLERGEYTPDAFRYSRGMARRGYRAARKKAA